MDRRAVAAYFLMVARQASSRADAADRLGISGTAPDVARLQAQHERQLAAMAGLLSAWIAGGMPVEAHPRPGLWARVRMAWSVLWS